MRARRCGRRAKPVPASATTRSSIGLPRTTASRRWNRACRSRTTAWRPSVLPEQRREQDRGVGLRGTCRTARAAPGTGPACRRPPRCGPPARGAGDAGPGAGGRPGRALPMMASPSTRASSPQACSSTSGLGLCGSSSAACTTRCAACAGRAAAPERRASSRRASGLAARQSGGRPASGVQSAEPSAAMVATLVLPPSQAAGFELLDPAAHGGQHGSAAGLVAGQGLPGFHLSHRSSPAREGPRRPRCAGPGAPWRAGALPPGCPPGGPRSA